MVSLVLLGWLANLDPLESLVLPVFRDALERLDHQVSLEPRATVVSLVFKDFQGLLDPKDKRDLQEKMERTASQAQWVAVVLLDLMELLVGWVILVPWVPEECKERKAKEERQENWVRLDLPGLLARDLVLTWRHCQQ